MRTLAWLLGLVVLLPACGLADEVSIACWNVENLFDWKRDEVADASNDELPSEATVRVKLRKDAEIIALLKADIVGLVEVENRNCLRLLCQEYLADHGYEHYVLIDEADPRGIDTAIISKRPFTAQSFRVPGFSRGILAGRFVIDGEPVYVLVNHWKSRRVSQEGEDTESVRLRCADRVNELVSKVIPEMEGRPAHVLVMGDLNDDDEDKSVKKLTDAGMLNLLSSLPKEKRWTLPYYNTQKKNLQLNQFDHAICTPGLKDGKGIDVSEAEVVRPKQMITKRTYDGVQYEWTDRDFADHIGYSDHFPVRVKIRKVD